MKPKNINVEAVNLKAGREPARVMARLLRQAREFYTAELRKGKREDL